MLVRLLIVAACYLLSSYGIILSLAMWSAKLWMGLLFSAAWLAHLVMSVAWIRHRRLGCAWPVGGTLAGIASLAVMPFGLVMVAPCVLLACYLVWFHCRRTPAGRSESETTSPTRE